MHAHSGDAPVTPGDLVHSQGAHRIGHFYLNCVKQEGRVLNTHCRWGKSEECSACGTNPNPAIKVEPSGPYGHPPGLFVCLKWDPRARATPALKYKNKTHCYARFFFNGFASLSLLCEESKTFFKFFKRHPVSSHAGLWDWLHFKIWGTMLMVFWAFSLWGLCRWQPSFAEPLAWVAHQSQQKQSRGWGVNNCWWSQDEPKGGMVPSDAWLQLVYYWAWEGWFSFPQTCQHRASSSSPRLVHHTDCPRKQGANEVPMWFLWPEEHKVGYVFPREVSCVFKTWILGWSKFLVEVLLLGVERLCEEEPSPTKKKPPTQQVRKSDMGMAAEPHSSEQTYSQIRTAPFRSGPQADQNHTI